jgi:hypothetical protein
LERAARNGQNSWPTLITLEMTVAFRRSISLPNTKRTSGRKPTKPAAVAAQILDQLSLGRLSIPLAVRAYNRMGGSSRDELSKCRVLLAALIDRHVSNSGFHLNTELVWRIPGKRHDLTARTDSETPAHVQHQGQNVRTAGDLPQPIWVGRRVGQILFDLMFNRRRKMIAWLAWLFSDRVHALVQSAIRMFRRSSIRFHWATTKSHNSCSDALGFLRRKKCGEPHRLGTSM